MEPIVTQRWPQPGPPKGDEIVTADLGDVLKQEKPSSWRTMRISERVAFVVIGCFAFGLLSFIPVWNALTLLSDSNYVFWVGTGLPKCIIFVCFSIIVVYAVLVSCFFTRQRSMDFTEQAMMMLTSIVITMFGLALMTLSLPLTHQAELTYTSLMFRCDSAESTHRLFEYATVLHNIRAKPECAQKFSVEECVGYEEAFPYTDYLRGMERNYHCSGFCQPMVHRTSNASFVSIGQRIKKRYSKQDSKLEAETESSSIAACGGDGHCYAPALFTDATSRRPSCEGMAARDIKNFAGNIGQQLYLQGLFLVLIAVVTGLLKLLSFCMNPTYELGQEKESAVAWNAVFAPTMMPGVKPQIPSQAFLRPVVPMPVATAPVSAARVPWQPAFTQVPLQQSVTQMPVQQSVTTVPFEQIDEDEEPEDHVYERDDNARTQDFSQPVAMNTLGRPPTAFPVPSNISMVPPVPGGSFFPPTASVASQRLMLPPTASAGSQNLFGSQFVPPTALSGSERVIFGSQVMPPPTDIVFDQQPLTMMRDPPGYPPPN